MSTPANTIAAAPPSPVSPPPDGAAAATNATEEEEEEDDDDDDDEEVAFDASSFPLFTSSMTDMRSLIRVMRPFTLST